MLYAKFQSNISSGFGEKVNFSGLAIFSHSGFLTSFDICEHQGPTYTPYKISAKYTKPFWRNGLECQGRRKFYRVDVNFQTVIVT